MSATGITSPFELVKELETAHELAVQAGEILLKYHGSGIRVERKKDNEEVTVADREASAFLVDRLTKAFPDDHVLSEEAPDEPDKRLAARRVWMIDPMDGTRDFIHGHEGFSVMIGLTIEHQPVLGVVFQPIGSNLYLGAPGLAAIIVKGGARRRLKVSTVADPAEVRLVASKSHRDDKIDEVRKALGTHDELNVGSVGLKLGLIARGDRDLYVNPSSMSSLWDTCAPQAILSEAGGKLTDLYGDPIDYASRTLKNTRGLLASNTVLHEPVLAKLTPLFPKNKTKRGH